MTKRPESENDECEEVFNKPIAFEEANVKIKLEAEDTIWESEECSDYPVTEQLENPKYKQGTQKTKNKKFAPFCRTCDERFSNIAELNLHYKTNSGHALETEIPRLFEELLLVSVVQLGIKIINV
ncbi:hypothetical protein NQ317_011892 [Molorchus minor]|uniref:C2H2-type domain-containing protein n=1 Tax=Molorchus minor TaxID=1323400 RepID=A0ABQ9JTG3_9CUCU|nr:hypothetical protein NQ317_011892 [Molorchus minor]